MNQALEILHHQPHYKTKLLKSNICHKTIFFITLLKMFGGARKKNTANRLTDKEGKEGFLPQKRRTIRKSHSKEKSAIVRGKLGRINLTGKLGLARKLSRRYHVSNKC